MKKLLVIPALFLSAGSLFLISCGNSDTNTSMRSPVQTNADSVSQKENEKSENKSIVKTVSLETNKEAGLKTTENMQAAFKGETNASAKYNAYSKKAEQEGYHEIALLFKAASMSENIHASNHKAVLQESGITVQQIKPDFIVKSTRENLEDAIKGETYEVTTMYPEFLTVANEAGNQIALISLNYAYKTEKKHKVYYEKALDNLNNHTAKTLPTVYYVCPTCGNTFEMTAPGRCGISMTGKERFIKIS